MLVVVVVRVEGQGLSTSNDIGGGTTAIVSSLLLRYNGASKW